VLHFLFAIIFLFLCKPSQLKKREIITLIATVITLICTVVATFHQIRKDYRRVINYLQEMVEHKTPPSSSAQPVKDKDTTKSISPKQSVTPAPTLDSLKDQGRTLPIPSIGPMIIHPIHRPKKPRNKKHKPSIPKHPIAKKHIVPIIQPTLPVATPQTRMMVGASNSKNKALYPGNYHSSYPGNDIPVIHLRSDNEIFNRYIPGYGGIVFWTDCEDCNWQISLNFHPYQPLAAHYDVIPEPIPPKLVFYQYKAGAKTIFMLKDRSGRVYDKQWIFSVQPGETIECEIEKKPNQ